MTKLMKLSTSGENQPLAFPVQPGYQGEAIPPTVPQSYGAFPVQPGYQGEAIPPTVPQSHGAFTVVRNQDDHAVLANCTL